MKLEWEKQEAGAHAYEKSGEYIPQALIDSFERTGIGLKGPVTTPIGGGFSSIKWLCESVSSSTPTSVLSRICLSGWCQVPTSVTIALSSRQCTVRPLTSPGEASPIPLLFCSPLMLRHLGEAEAADRVKSAVDRVYRSGKMLTPDVGGTVATSQFADAVIEAMSEAPAPVSG